MNNLIFNPTRFTQLLQKELLSGQKRLLIIMGGTFGLMILFACFLIYTGGDYLNFNIAFFPFVLFIGGAVFTSLIFYEFNDKIGTHHYLSLPASTLEKFSSKWFISAILFPIVVVMLFWSYSKIGDAYYNYIYDKVVSTWTLNDWWSWFFIKLYLAGQTIYLLGAVAFQKYTYFKTSLAGFLAFVLFVVICVAGYRIIFAEYFESFWMLRNDINYGPNESARAFLSGGSFRRMGDIALYILLPATMLIAGFFRLKEKEA